jgi:hypothetical protein
MGELAPWGTAATGCRGGAATVPPKDAREGATITAGSGGAAAVVAEGTRPLTSRQQPGGKEMGATAKGRVHKRVAARRARCAAGGEGEGHRAVGREKDGLDGAEEAALLEQQSWTEAWGWGDRRGAWGVNFAP